MGNYTNAYATLKPLEGSLVDLVESFENQDNVLRKEALIKAAQEAQLKQRQDEVNQRRLDSITFPEMKLSGVPTMDEVQIRALLSAATQSNLDRREYLTATPERQRELEGRMRMLNLTPDQIFASSQAVKAMQDQIKTGKYHTNSTLDNFLANGAMDWTPAHDEKGNLMMGFRNKTIVDGQIVENKDFVQYGDITGQTPKFQLDEKFDREELLAKDTHLVGLHTEGKDDGTTKTTTTNPRLDSTFTVAKKRIRTLDGGLTPEGKSLAITEGLSLTMKNQNGEEVPNKVGFDKLEASYAKQLDLSKSTEHIKDKNLTLAMFRLQQEENKRQEAAAAKIKNLDSDGIAIGDKPSTVTQRGPNTQGYSYEHQVGDQIYAIENGLNKKTGTNLTQISMNKDGTWTYFVENSKILETDLTEEAQEKWKNGELTQKTLSDSDFIEGKSPYSAYQEGEGMDTASAKQVVIQLVNPVTKQNFQNLQEVHEFVKGAINNASKQTKMTADDYYKKYGNK